MSLINTEKIKTSFRKLEKEIHQWLEPATPPKVPYQVSLDFENDRFQFQTTDKEEFYILLFSRLSNYFEKGFLLEGQFANALPSWFCTLHFSDGQIFMAEPSIQTEFSLPSPGPHQVLSSSPARWNLKSPEWLQMLPQSKEWTALIFEIAPEIRFLFCTQLAEPWLKVQTENAHKFIEAALTVQP